MRKLNLAFVSPLPPLKSGISDYSVTLLSVLSVYYNIDVIVDDYEVKDLSVKENASIRTVGYFKANHKAYDRVIYHFGNSPFHLYMIELIISFSGVLVLHDFYLGDLFEAAGILDEKFIYEECGYKALLDCKNNNQIFTQNFACNKSILNNSQGVIVHSNYSKKLAKDYYEHINLQKWHKIPLLRVPSEEKDILSKAQLGFNNDDFIVCSFGLMTQNKMSLELIKAWLDSLLAKQANAHLVFVGAQEKSAYIAEINKLVEQYKNIHLTDWVDSSKYKSYLSIADIAVQLRKNSRGESSASILDCMNYGVATIANANGASIELDSKALYFLEDKFSLLSLSEALDTLYRDEILRKEIATYAQSYVKKFHSPELCAQLYYESIEKSYMTSTVEVDWKLPVEKQLELVSLSYFDLVSQRQILIDVSSIIQNDLKTGIQRVVRSQLTELVLNSPDNFRVEAVYFSHEEDSYFYAREYTQKLLGIECSDIYDEPVFVNKGDIFYGLDLCAGEVEQVKKIGLFEHYRYLGLRIIFVIYDLLPIQHPSFFPPGAFETHTLWLQNIVDVSDQLICISESVASELKDWLKTNKPHKLDDMDVTFLHIGVDKLFTQAIKRKECSENLHFLMVGTIEPRKGHAQILKVFEELWREGLDVELTIVGKKGWMVEDFLRSLATHPERNKRLFFLEAISDDELVDVYSTSNIVIVASEAEGFGLPLIEAAQFNLPIVARDIPVFHEVAKSNAYYFKNTNNSLEIALEIKNYIKLFKEGSHPRSQNIGYLSWQENVQQLWKVFKEE